MQITIDKYIKYCLHVKYRIPVVTLHEFSREISLMEINMRSTMVKMATYQVCDSLMFARFADY